MPKTPVNKNNQTFPPKSKVGFARQFLISPPTCIPFARKIKINLSSVSLFPLDLIAAMTCERFFFENTSAIAF